jgi:hypothetical protein
MSAFDLLNTVFHQCLPISPTARHVLLQLLGHRNSKIGICNPSTKSLHLSTGYSRRTIISALNELRGADLITVKIQHRKPNEYDFTIPPRPRRLRAKVAR